jgi:hypothetical protein
LYRQKKKKKKKKKEKRRRRRREINNVNTGIQFILVANIPFSCKITGYFILFLLFGAAVRFPKCVP